RPGAERRRLTERVYEFFPQLAALRGREAGLLSGGERQMLAIGSALMCAPQLLLVDELSQGLAPLLVEQLMQRLQAIRRELGMTLLLVEQNDRTAPARRACSTASAASTAPPAGRYSSAARTSPGRDRTQLPGSASRAPSSTASCCRT